MENLEFIQEDAGNTQDLPGTPDEIQINTETDIETDTEFLSIPEKNKLAERESHIEKIKNMKDRYGKFTKEDKFLIRAIAKSLGLKMGYCQNCYNDAYLEIRNIFGITESSKMKDAEGGWKFAGHQGTIWHGPFGNVMLSEMTPISMIEKYVNMNPKQKIFIRIEN